MSKPGNPKSALRQHALHVRAQLPMELISAAICGHLKYWPVFQAARQVLFYHPFRNEVDLRPLTIDFPNKHWYLPVVEEADHLAFYRYDPAHPMKAGKYGIWEPHGNAPPLETLAPDDLLITPGLLFDRLGYRLGYGKGYFDKYLHGLKTQGALCRLAGVAPDALLIDRLPSDDWDIPMECVLSETGLTRPHQEPFQ